jgi:prepilin-type N-terminal cleavage/methylation domain-containing protein
MPNHHQGFTYIELISVIVILGILVMAVSPKYVFSTSTTAASFKHLLMEDLRLTRVLAVSENSDYQLVIDSSGYEIQDGSGTTFNHPDSDNNKINFPNGVSISPSSLTIVFNRLGQPLDGGSVTSNDTTLTLTVGGQTQVITITGQTGYIDG